MALQVYSTLTRKKGPFQTVVPGKVSMYVCGPTVYKPSHVGHMVGPVIFDTVKRYLTYLGYDVTFVVNITDVDDKLIIRAKELGTTVKELAEKMTTDYVECLRQLGVTRIDRMPRATEHIAEMIGMMESLIAKGFAYPAGGDVYFDISHDDDYGKLCNRDPEQLEAGSRVEVTDKKRNPGDFALWKGSKPGEPAWDSPWGPGRPGWHIECSAMAMKYLGETLDIHGGGLDLQFPHHENELAQSESFNGKTFANYWLHNGLMKIGNEKISKSNEEEQKKKATLVVTEVLAKHHAETLRFLLLNTHYRSPIDYGDERLVEMRKGLESFYRFFERFQRVTGESFYLLPGAKSHTTALPSIENATWAETVKRSRTDFLACMDDDFNTGGAIGGLFEYLSALNKFADSNKIDDPKTTASLKSDFKAGAIVLRELGDLLGLFHQPVTVAASANDGLVAGLMQLLIDLRSEAKSAKNYAMSDTIRKRLAELNVTLEDRKEGTSWRVG